MDAVLDAFCEGIDALDPDLMSSVLLADPDGQRLWPAAGPRVPEDYKQLISPLPIASAMAACGTAAYRKERVISQPRAPATCQECGRTLCCDNSPNRHATRHAQVSGHRVIASAEPGEKWLYCYPDDTFAEY